MAEPFEAEIKIKGARQARRDLQKLDRATDDLSKSTGNAGTSMASFAAGLGGATVALGAAVKGIKSAVGALKDFAAEFEKQSAILNRFNGDVSEASKRLNGLVSDIDLMKAQAVLLNSGLNVSKEQFADLAVAANEMAAATGRDGGAQAINELARAVARAQSGKLKEFGIDLSQVTDVSEKQQLALDALSEKYGGLESSADTLGGKLDVLRVSLDNIETQFISTLNSSDRMNESIDRLGQTIHDVFGVGTGNLIDDLTDSIALHLASAIATAADEMTRLVQGFDALKRGNIKEAIDKLGVFLGPVNAGMSFAETFQANMAANRASLAAARSGRAQGPGGPTILDPFIIEGNVPRGRGRGRAQDPFAQDTLSGLGRDVLGGLGPEQSFVGGVGPATGRGIGGAFGSQAAQARNNFEELQRDILPKLQGGFAELAAELDRIAKASQEAMENMADTGQFVAETLISGAQIAKDENKSFIEGIGDVLKAKLNAIAIEEGIAGARDLATALGSVVENPPLAESKFLSSAEHFAVAAAAGAGGAVAGSLGGGGGGGGSASAARPEADSANDNGGGNGGGTLVININAPVAEQEQGRLYRRSSRAAEKRFAAG